MVASPPPSRATTTPPQFLYPAYVDTVIIISGRATVILRLHVRMRRTGVKFDCGVVFGGKNFDPILLRNPAVWRRQCGQVVRALELQFRGPEFISHSDR